MTDLDDLLRSQAESDEDAMYSTYSMIEGFVWAIPVLGFIGTVLGLSDAIGGFGKVLTNASDISQLTDSLKGVTAGLSKAFETTLGGAGGGAGRAVAAHAVEKERGGFFGRVLGVLPAPCRGQATNSAV